MFGWFRAPAACPIDPESRAWLDRRWAWLEGEFGPGLVRESPLVLPTPEFFPDPYDGGPEGARAVLDRLCGLVRLDPATVELHFYEERGPALGHGESQGTAGLYGRAGGRALVAVEVGSLADPLALVATMAHELGHELLLGQGRVSPDEPDHEPLTDLLTVYLGLGVFSANAAVREANWTFGQYSGWSASRRGYLDLRQYGYAFARYALARGEDGSAWSGELRLDVRTAFKQSMRVLAAG